LRLLRRVAVGPFTIGEAAGPDDCVVLPPIEAVRGMARVDVDAATAVRIGDGALLPAPAGDGPWAMVAEDDRLLAVYEPLGPGRVKPAVVVVPG
jgi:tRNA pseudouridine55 synthase